MKLLKYGVWALSFRELSTEQVLSWVSVHSSYYSTIEQYHEGLNWFVLSCLRYASGRNQQLSNGAHINICRNRRVPLCTLQFPVYSNKLWFKFSSLATVQGGIEMWGGGVGAVRKIYFTGPGSSLPYRYITRWAHVHKTTHGPMIDMALYVMLLMHENPLLGQVEGG